MRIALLLALLPGLALAGDPVKGRSIATGRGEASCVLCHAIPGAAQPAGNLGPSLAGIGRRMSADELKARIVDPSRFNADTAMPAYGRTRGLHDVDRRYRGKPLLTARQTDDVVAFLLTLK
jgi:L-cysteine S-thiosulfotransferase